MDPITAITTATTAFNTVKKMVAMGRDVDDTLAQIGKWYGAIADLGEAEKIAQNPPIFRKLVSSKSVEQEAMDVYAAKKRAQQQEKELRELLMYTYGPNGYQEMVDLRRSIKEKRERTIYAQARRRRDLFWNTVQGILVVVMAVILWELYSFMFIDPYKT